MGQTNDADGMLSLLATMKEIERLRLSAYCREKLASDVARLNPMFVERLHQMLSGVDSDVSEAEAEHSAKHRLDDWISGRILCNRRDKLISPMLWVDLARAKHFIFPGFGGGGCYLTESLWRTLGHHLDNWTDRISRFRW